MPEDKKKESGEATEKKRYSRRDFLLKSGTATAVALTPAIASATADPAAAPSKKENFEYLASEGYLVYDSKKCAGCTTCMMSCSLAHYGVQSQSLSRIQIMQDSWGKFPYDVKMAVCRQCVTPVCVKNCPTGAAYVDSENGNVRRIDSKKCIGCQTCLKMCPQQPHRPVWNHTIGRSSKCDLCIDTPYWNEKGGPGGKQACVESCPMKAIKFVAEIPNQQETEGYDVNLRNDHWLNLGLVDSSEVIPPVVAERMKNAPKPGEVAQVETRHRSMRVP
jgi:protein NrfC